MDETNALRQNLNHLKDVLQQNGEDHFAGLVATALSGSEGDLKAFLVSEALWGGPGSIADMAGHGKDRQVQRLIEAALIKLGEQQINDGVAEYHAAYHTQIWVAKYQSWRRKGI